MLNCLNRGKLVKADMVTSIRTKYLSIMRKPDHALFAKPQSTKDRKSGKGSKQSAIIKNRKCFSCFKSEHYANERPDKDKGCSLCGSNSHVPKPCLGSALTSALAGVPTDDGAERLDTVAASNYVDVCERESVGATSGTTRRGGEVSAAANFSIF